MIEKARRTGATELELAGMGLTEIPDSIAQLSQLQKLNLSSNEITDIPDTIAELSNLQELRFGGNKITAIPYRFAQLSQLQRLYLYNNRITTIPKAIGHLSQLQVLDLYNNQITIIPHDIAQLSQLEVLDLSNNRLTRVSEQLFQLTKLRALFLHGNPGLDIPEEILGPSSEDVDILQKEAKPAREILSYLSRAEENSRPLNEAKLILVGQGSVGKTSLVKALATGEFESGEKTTEGIKINDWECPLGKKNKAMVHIWDFGGQEMMHATHQFFLTARSLYLLVLNRRQGGIDREADYWFRLVRAFGGKDAPVIVVLNKQKAEPFEVNREAGWKNTGQRQGLCRH